MPSLYVGESTLQYAQPIQVANTLWADPEWIAEELITGYRAILTSGQDANSLFVAKKCCNGHSLGKVLTNNFTHIKDLPIFKKVGECDIDCVVISSQKSELESIFDMGPLGAERHNLKLGPFKLVFLDIFKYRGSSVKGCPWKVRYSFMEDVFRKLDSPHVKLIHPISEHKREYFDRLVAEGSKGVVLKDINATYSSGMSRGCLEVRGGVRPGYNNVSLREGFNPKTTASSQRGDDGFDFDTYLALQALDSSENIDKLLNS